MNPGSDADGGADSSGRGEGADDGADPPRALADATTASGWTDDLADRLGGSAPLFVLSDFDGTLAAITDRPDEATIREDARAALVALADAQGVDVAVVSGRALADVRDRVGIEGIGYGGNHGLEIRMDGEEFYHPEAAEAAEAIDRAVATLEDRLADVEGVLIETKGPTAAIHYRQVAEPAAVERVRSAVVAVAETEDRLRTSAGKDLVELRPAVDWDKGRAVEWLLDVATPDDWSGTPVYLGDDAVDEPAFAALNERDGITVRVGADDAATAARYSLASPADVAALLEWLVAARGE